ncbi:MAG: NAD(P)H-hydrate dehydratase [Planctomycetes bacterium]|nr:NAD(P)H-hydrate dehydratase [Planctomycetota bacterium]
MTDPLVLPPLRRPDAHKGDAGRVLLIAGSRGMAGAAALAARGALRAGAGLVTVAIPEPIEPVLATKLDCAMTIPLPAAPPGVIAAEALSAALERATAADVVGAGPGMGTAPETRAFLVGLLGALRRPLVLDADGLNLASLGALDFLAGYALPKILTPHPGEMSRLLGTTTRDVQADRPGAAVEAARRFAAVVVLKGANTVVTDGHAVHINRTGNPGMATGGSGDVLTGVITALLAQRMEPLAAARLGAHVHGLAGDLAAAAKGPISMTAADLVDHLPAAFLALETAS